MSTTCDRCGQTVDAGIEQVAGRHLACSPPIISQSARDLMIEAAAALEGWVQSESQYPEHANDPSWKLADRLRTAAGVPRG